MPPISAVHPHRTVLTTRTDTPLRPHPGIDTHTTTIRMDALDHYLDQMRYQRRKIT